MICKYLSIDIGFKNPSFVIIDHDESLNFISNIFIYKNINIQKIEEISFFLNYFISKKINKVIIEKQFIGKNINLMYFIYGYFNAKKIEVIIKNPIAYLLNINKNNLINSRKIKKTFSVDLLNNIFKKNNIDYKFSYKFNDICDSINICLHYLFNKTKKNKKESFIDNFSINILNIEFILIEVIINNA